MWRSRAPSARHGDLGLRFRRSFSQPRSLGGRRPVDRAAGAALRLIDLTHVRVYSRATHYDFFSAFFDPTIGRRLAFACFPVFFDHFDWQNLFSNQKKKRPCKHSTGLSGGLLVSEFFQSEKQRSLDDQQHRSDGLHWANRKSIVTQSLNWKRGPFSLSRSWYRTLTDVQTPIVRSITHKQTWLHMNSDVHCMRNSSLAPGVNNRRFPSPKTKPCEKLKKSFLFAFGHSLSFPLFFFFFLTFHRSTVELKTDLATRQEKLKISRCTETCIGPTVGAVGPTVGAGWLRWSSSFRNFANFLPRTKLFAPKQSLKTWLFKTPAKM